MAQYNFYSHGTMTINQSLLNDHFQDVYNFFEFYSMRGYAEQYEVIIEMDTSKLKKLYKENNGIFNGPVSLEFAAWYDDIFGEKIKYLRHDLTLLIDNIKKDLQETDPNSELLNFDLQSFMRLLEDDCYHITVEVTDMELRENILIHMEYELIVNGNTEYGPYRINFDYKDPKIDTLPFTPKNLIKYDLASSNTFKISRDLKETWNQKAFKLYYNQVKL